MVAPERLAKVRAALPDAMAGLAETAKRFASLDRRGPQKYVTWSLQRLAPGLDEVEDPTLAWEMWTVINHELCRLVTVHWPEWTGQVVETEAELHLELKRGGADEQR